MFKTKTVIIVGAGASHEVGLPCGDPFKMAIAQLLDFRFQDFRITHGDKQIYDALHEHVKTPSDRGDINQYFNAALQIKDAMPQATSIDFFLDHHRNKEPIEICGKLAIVRTILDAERRSKLFIDSNKREKMQFANLQESWYSDCWKLLTTSAYQDNLVPLFENVSFIVFNYDRCIEHFLYHSLQNYSGLSPEQSAALIQHLKIFHPYGRVGNLPWQPGPNPTHFGESDLRAERLLSLAAGIKTFTERIGDGADIAEMRSAIAKAQTMLFLGFAFHEQNMTLMNPTETYDVQKNVYASMFGISDSDSSVINDKIAGLIEGRSGHGSIGLQIKTCHELFREYWHRLSMA